MSFKTRYKKYKLATLIISLFFGGSFTAGLICLFGFTLNVNADVTYYALAQDNTDNEKLMNPFVLDTNKIGSKKVTMDTINNQRWEVTLINEYDLNGSIYKIDVNLSIGWSNATKINSASIESVSKFSTYNQITFQDYLKKEVNSKSNLKYKKLNDYMNKRTKTIETEIKNLNSWKNKTNEYLEQYLLISEFLKENDNRKEIEKSRNNIKDINNLVDLNLKSFNNELSFSNKVNNVRVLFFVSLSLFLFSGGCLFASLILLCLQIKEKVRGDYEIQKKQFDLSLFR